MSNFGRIFWNNNDFTNFFTISESTEIRGTAVTSRISAPTEKAEVIQILGYGVNRSLVTITGNGCSLKQILSSIKIMIYCRF